MKNANTISRDNVIELFKDREPSLDLTAAIYPGQNLSLGGTVENTARQFAVRERFDEMCSDILWGSEDQVKFIEMLRGLVETFLPQTRYHLQLLKVVASFTWQLERIGLTQHNIFQSSDGSVGRFRLPRATHDAMALRPEASGLVRDLQVAIRVYKDVRGKI